LSQKGTPASSAVQSVALMHWTQRSRVVSQSGRFATPAQSGVARHCTHDAAVVLHFGVGAAHCVSFAQVAMQRFSRGSQTLPAAQSALVEHSTQVKLPRKQCGLAAGHSLFCVHCTHVFVVGSQSGAPAGHVAEV
jgi:hypothetical protein